MINTHLQRRGFEPLDSRRAPFRQRIHVRKDPRDLRTRSAAHVDASFKSPSACRANRDHVYARIPWLMKKQAGCRLLLIELSKVTLRIVSNSGASFCTSYH